MGTGTVPAGGKSTHSGWSGQKSPRSQGRLPPCPNALSVVSEPTLAGPYVAAPGGLKRSKAALPSLIVPQDARTCIRAQMSFTKRFCSGVLRAHSELGKGFPAKGMLSSPPKCPRTSPRTADTARQAWCQVSLCPAGPRGPRPAESVSDGGGGGSEPSRSRSRRGAEQVGDEEGRRSAMIGTML